VVSGDGPIVDSHGRRLGTHGGLFRYTIGQRKGLGALGRRMFVKRIRPEDNTLVVADDEEVVSTGILVENFVKGPFKIELGEIFDVRVRYRSRAVPSRVNSIENDRLELIFDKPVRAVAPGQSAVLYRDDQVIGGGIITKDY
jgi:tRNA-specific 2-thiouridylase